MATTAPQRNHGSHNNHHQIEVVIILGILRTKQEVGALQSIIRIREHGRKGKEKRPSPSTDNAHSREGAAQKKFKAI